MTAKALCDEQRVAQGILTKQSTIDRLVALADSLPRGAPKTAIRYLLIPQVKKSSCYRALIAAEADDRTVLLQLKRSGYLDAYDSKLGLNKNIWTTIYRATPQAEPARMIA